ncbi:TonB-dependent receptor [Asaia bogorensis]|uniref:TonB-dependent receptor n=1 Tax=Asaia bogorensis TaxID=91915 RepID=UPI00285AABB1|nr:TonB-dependent receptor [Asaia bogorensis]MDR6182673.1 iron complex outermembrane receptor protein [Asaia bogorensis NBRC 16594]
MRNIRNPHSGVSLSGPGIVLIAALGMALPPDALAEGKPGNNAVGPGRTGDDIATRDAPKRHITRPHREGQGGETSARHQRNHEVLTVMGARGGYAAAESAMGDKRATPFLQQTQTTNVVTHQTLADFSPQTIEDMAKYVPGMAIGNNFGGTQDALIKRGFGAIDDGSILRDGVRMPIGRNYQGDTAERVEILKGPASLFYGMQEPGGVINVITKAPDFRRWGAALGTQWSSLGGGNGHVDVTGPLGKTLAFRLIGSYRNENYWRNFGANKQILVAPTLNWHHERWDGTLSYEYVDYDNVLDRGAVFVGNNPVSGPQKRLDEPWTASFGARHLIASHLGYRIGMHDRLRLSGGYNRDDYHDRQADPSSYSARTGILLRRYRANGGTIRANGSVALDYLGDHDLWGMRHEITAGIDYENRNQNQGVFYQSANQGGFTPANPVYGGLAPVGRPNPANSNLQQNINTASDYLKDNIHLTRSLIASGGVRYQWFGLRYGSGIPFIQTTDASYTKPLPFAALVWQPFRSVSFYGDYSQSFGANQLSAGSVLQGGYKPTTGREFEVGARYAHGGLTADLALYHIRKKNVLQTAGQDRDGNIVQRLTGLAGSKGLEASVTGALSAHWSTVLAYAWTDARTLRDTPATEGRQLIGVPKNSGSLFLTWNGVLPWHAVSMRAGGGVHLVGTRSAALDNSFQVPGYGTVDAFASWTVTQLFARQISLQLNAVNLLNQGYIIAPTGSVYRNSWGQGRSFAVATSIAF